MTIEEKMMADKDGNVYSIEALREYFENTTLDMDTVLSRNDKERGRLRAIAEEKEENKKDKEEETKAPQNEEQEEKKAKREALKKENIEKKLDLRKANLEKEREREEFLDSIKQSRSLQKGEKE